jgi:hypothetical protein
MICPCWQSCQSTGIHLPDSDADIAAYRARCRDQQIACPCRERRQVYSAKRRTRIAPLNSEQVFIVYKIMNFKSLRIY